LYSNPAPKTASFTKYSKKIHNSFIFSRYRYTYKHLEVEEMEKVNGISIKTRNNWLLDTGLFLTAIVTVLSGIYFLFVPSGGYQGGRNPFYGVNVLFERETWEWLHTWIGLGMVIVALGHLIFHWKWVVGMVKRLAGAVKSGKSTLNPNGRYNLVVNTTIALSFLISAISGVYFLLAGSSEGGRNPDPMFLFSRGTWDVVHTWSSILFITAGLLHFVMHWGWVTKVTRKVFGASPAAVQISKVGNEPARKTHTMIKKIAGTAALVLVIGMLAFGGVKRTYAESNSAVEIDSLVGYSVSGSGNGYGGGNESTGELEFPGYGELATSLETLPSGTLNQSEKDALLFMYEEEKMARDLYTLFGGLWDKPMFDNISRAEQTHMDTVQVLMERYEIALPGTNEAGIYSNVELQTLYARLSAQGSLSEADALLAGGAVEEIDILDLRERLTQTDQADIQTVFENLLSGSINHLNSFASVYLVETDKGYVPQFMTTTDYGSIITSTASQGGYGGGKGYGCGNGRR
jgi:hypothetical protein